MVADRGGRRNNVYTYFFVNDRIMYSPTTSPYGYSSFPKEENEVTAVLFLSVKKEVKLYSYKSANGVL